MDPVLKTYMASCKHGVDLWVAVDGMVVSGTTVFIFDFFRRLLEVRNQDDEEYCRIINQALENNGGVDEPPLTDGEKNPLIIFNEANIFIDGKFITRSPASVDPDRIVAWGPCVLGLASNPE